MRVIVTGGTGFIGKALCALLVQKGYEVVVLSRSAGKMKTDGTTTVKWDARSADNWGDYADGALAIVNLAGRNIAAQPWSEKVKKDLLQSRVQAGKAVLEAVESAANKPGVVIQGSAIGYYGSHKDKIFDESAARGSGFLASLTEQWEASTAAVEDRGVRRAIIRTGIVLGSDGGMLPRLLLPFRFFMGGTPGSGAQWFSWIHLHDEVMAICYLMENKELSGVFNLTAPEPVTLRELTTRPAD